MKIKWTPVAVEHLQSAYEYSSVQNPAAAARLIQRVVTAIEALERHPHLGRQGRVEGTRELVVPRTPFLVAYRVHKDQVHILAVLHGKQRWPDRF